MEKACSMHGGDETCIKILVGKPEEKRDYSEYLCVRVDWRMTLKWILRQ
jgi:hypothetical protein